MSLTLVLLIAGLGALGAVIRYVMVEFFTRRSLGMVGIVVVNLAGSALAGALAHNPDNALAVAGLIGFCGSLTTFSTVAASALPRTPSLARPALAGLLVTHALGSVIAAWTGFNLVVLTG
jgi:CrcB protein